MANFITQICNKNLHIKNILLSLHHNKETTNNGEDRLKQGDM